MNLAINNLAVATKSGKNILKDFSIEVKKNEIHAIMGPNGAGKSTLGRVIEGDSRYQILLGTIESQGENLFKYPSSERACRGIFVSRQDPPEIDGLQFGYFLRTAFNERQKYLGKKELNPVEFIKILRQKMELLNLEKTLPSKYLNWHSSGGEKKRHEVLQMLLFSPKISFLDEIDSGLDLDSLKLVANRISEYCQAEESSLVLITHYNRLLHYLKPDYVHIMIQGKIVTTGDNSLADLLEERGYQHFISRKYRNEA